jgi:hypothetical protein
VVQLRVGIAAAATLLVGLGTAGCGAHHDPAATGSPTSPSSPTGQQPSGSQSGHHGRHSGRSAGTPGKGTYDDTSGTRAKSPKNQSAVLTHLPGSTSSGCVAVGKRTDVRSGRMAMGNFADARAAFAQAKTAYDAAQSFFYVIPMSRSVTSVTVTATPLGRGGAPVHVRATDVEQAAQWKYFPIHLTLPSAGGWRFRVTSSSGHSCFDATFKV